MDIPVPRPVQNLHAGLTGRIHRHKRMVADPRTAFADPTRHARASEIIRRYSTNKTDVRLALLADLDLTAVRSVLDLGCGFGFMTELLARRVAPDAEIIGVDACPANEQPYLARVAASGRRGRFLCREITRELEWPDAAFDLVVASYSTYFFPEVLPDIARVLKPTGLFFTITHTEAACRTLLESAGLDDDRRGLMQVIRRFSAERAPALLSRWFGRIERVEYRNMLVFERADYDDFLRYLWFKLPFLLGEPDDEGRPTGPLAEKIRAALASRPRVVICKDDVAFHCRVPRC